MYLIKVIILSLLSVSAFSQRFDLAQYLPRDWRDAFEGKSSFSKDNFDIHTFVKDLNYPIENHWVITEDGYVLQIHRIGARNQHDFISKKKKAAVLVMHGLGGSSIDWVLWGPDTSIGLLLADDGYDVWLGNNRGNLWSRNNVRLNPDIDKEFWDFSFERCGYYDLPAMIDYILQYTGEQKLFYVGHSQGTSQFFAMASLRPEYNNKIALMSAMAPVAYMTHLTSPIIRLAANYVEILTMITEWLSLYEYGSNGILTELLGYICSNPSNRELCVTVMFVISGFDSHQLNRDLVPTYMYTSGAGMSYNMLKHYGQEIKSRHFRRYDYGPSKNLELYGSKIPPDFNVSLITAPINVYYGENDFLASVKDVERLKKELPNASGNLISYKRWTHLDFHIAKDVNEIINNKILAQLQLYIDKGALTTSTTTTTTEVPQSRGHSFIYENHMYICLLIIIYVIY